MALKKRQLLSLCTDYHYFHQNLLYGSVTRSGVEMQLYILVVYT